MINHEKRVPDDSAQQRPENKTTRGNRRGSESTTKTQPMKEYVLIVCPKGTDEHAIVSSAETLKLVSSKINLVDAKIVLRGNRHISGSGIAFLTNSAEDLQ